MSIRIRCSYCKLQKTKREAVEKGLAVTVQPSVDDCGFDVYLHPRNVVIPDHARRRDEPDLPEVQYWVTWLFDGYEEHGCFC